jgi:hypothetical protein
MRAVSQAATPTKHAAKSRQCEAVILATALGFSDLLNALILFEKRSPCGRALFLPSDGEPNATSPVTYTNAQETTP